jgi:hypothetical protein
MSAAETDNTMILFTKTYVNFTSHIFCDANAERKGGKRKAPKSIFNLLDQNKKEKPHEILPKSLGNWVKCTADN